MRAALVLAVPAGLLSSGITVLGILGIFWTAGAAAWAVVIYMRSQRPAWITTSAGARIGLVTGLIAGWVAFGVSGIWLFVERVSFHQSVQIDEIYSVVLTSFQQRAHESMSGMSGQDAAAMQAWVAYVQRWLTSSEGHAGIWAIWLSIYCTFLLLFAVGGGALGARIQSRNRRPQV